MCIPNEILFQSFKCALRDRIARLVFYSCCCFLSVLCWFCCCWCCCCCCCYCWLPPNRLDSSLVVEHKPFAYSVLFVRRLESIDVCWLRFIFFYIIYFFLASHCRLHCVRSLYIGSYKKRSKSTIMYLDWMYLHLPKAFIFTRSHEIASKLWFMRTFYDIDNTFVCIFLNAFDRFCYPMNAF